MEGGGLGRAGLSLFPFGRGSRGIAQRQSRFDYRLQQQPGRRQQRLRLVLFLALEFSREWRYVLVGSFGSGGGSLEVGGVVTRVGPLAVKMAAEAYVCPARTGD